MSIKFVLLVPEKINNASFSFQITDDRNRNYIHKWIFDSEKPLCRERGLYELICQIPQLRLYQGKYYINAYFTGPPRGEVYDNVLNVCPFEVKMYNMIRQFEWQPDACAYLEDGSWEINKYDI